MKIEAEDSVNAANRFTTIAGLMVGLALLGTAWFFVSAILLVWRFSKAVWFLGSMRKLTLKHFTLIDPRNNTAGLRRTGSRLSIVAAVAIIAILGWGSKASSQTPFVTSVTLGKLRNDFNGWVGMEI